MAQTYSSQIEKVTFTFNIPIELKELEKWQKGIALALNDKEYMNLTKELGSDTGYVYKY